MPLSRKIVLTISATLIGVAIFHGTAKPPDRTPEASSQDPEPTLIEPSKKEESTTLIADLRALTTGQESLDYQALQDTLQSLVRTNPAAAADFACSLPAGTPREISLHRVAQAWAGRNPEAAATWADQLRNQEERGALLNDIFSEVAQHNPAKAIQMAEGHEMLSFSPGMTGNLIHQWATQDFDAALHWAGSQLGPLRDEAFVRLALVRVAHSPDEAARMISEQISPGSSQEEAAITVVSRWAASDPEAAKAWASTFEAGPFRERALNEITLASTIASGDGPRDRN